LEGDVASADDRAKFRAPRVEALFQPASQKFSRCGGASMRGDAVQEEDSTYNWEWYERLWVDEEKEEDGVWRRVRMRTKMGGWFWVREADYQEVQFQCSALLLSALCQLDLRLTIPGAARVVDLRAAPQ
jgi:hypothetical protein